MDYKIALLIDAENVSYKYLEAVIKEISNYGRLVVSRFYGDINKISKEWNNKAVNLAIKPMHQYNVATKKNAADMAMALDAMELLYLDKVNAFFIVSSDSDFAPLVIKLKEGGAFVVGIGEESKVTTPFVKSCNLFKYFEYLSDEKEEEKKSETVKTKIEKITKEDIENEIIDIIIENSTDNKMLLSQLGAILVNRHSDFDTRKYGSKNLLGLLSTIPTLEIVTENKALHVYISNSDTKEEIRKSITRIISKNKTKQMALSKLMQEILKIHKDFDYKKFGYIKFKEFLKSLEGFSIVNNNIAKYEEKSVK